MKSMANLMMQDALDDNIGYVYYPFLANVDSRITSPCFMSGQKFRLFSCYYPKFLLLLLIKKDCNSSIRLQMFMEIKVGAAKDPFFSKTSFAHD